MNAADLARLRAALVADGSSVELSDAEVAALARETIEFLRLLLGIAQARAQRAAPYCVKQVTKRRAELL